MVDDLVEQEGRALLEVALAHLLALLAAREERVDGLQLRVGHRDEVVGAHEEVELHDRQPVPVPVEARELQHHEEVVVVSVDLGALVARVDVLVVERVELEALLEPLLRRLARLGDVDPAQAVGRDRRWIRERLLRRDGHDWARAARGAQPAATSGRRARQAAPEPWREKEAAMW